MTGPRLDHKTSAYKGKATRPHKKPGRPLSPFHPEVMTLSHQGMKPKAIAERLKILPNKVHDILRYQRRKQRAPLKKP